MEHITLAQIATLPTLSVADISDDGTIAAIAAEPELAMALLPFEIESYYTLMTGMLDSTNAALIDDSFMAAYFAIQSA